MLMFESFARKLPFAGVLIVFLSFAGSLGATPRWDEDHCRHAIEHDEAKLHDAVHDHGWGSGAAEHWRHQLIEDRQRCSREVGRWWDGFDRSWHSDRDWDSGWDRYREQDHDHDHDHDHH